ncbi:hypothetical protein BCR34DRAFT_605364 [Clohesyomyces aquaticus]|uniref:EthD domain-containing protein n=1 Tax=Clohesyomyces aquaticus TaxID=1231657 RepID=A0A1Y1YYC3_9PLEO|nr:hypothetical protein BCR34DRAFT_605364 [Clohesyomyces aquaticus]
MSTPITVIVAYPSLHPETNQPIRFDFDYYKATHVPKVLEIWRKHEMLSFSIHKFQDLNPLTGQKQPYVLQSFAKFKSLDAFKAALADPASEGATTDVERVADVFPPFMGCRTDGGGDVLEDPLGIVRGRSEINQEA